MHHCITLKLSREQSHRVPPVGGNRIILTCWGSVFDHSYGPLHVAMACSCGRIAGTARSCCVFRPTDGPCQGRGWTTHREKKSSEQVQPQMVHDKTRSLFCSKQLGCSPAAQSQGSVCASAWRPACIQLLACWARDGRLQAYVLQSSNVLADRQSQMGVTTHLNYVILCATLLGGSKATPFSSTSAMRCSRDNSISPL